MTCEGICVSEGGEPHSSSYFHNVQQTDRVAQQMEGVAQQLTLAQSEVPIGLPVVGALRGIW